MEKGQKTRCGDTVKQGGNAREPEYHHVRLKTMLDLASMGRSLHDVARLQDALAGALAIISIEHYELVRHATDRAEAVVADPQVMRAMSLIRDVCL